MATAMPDPEPENRGRTPKRDGGNTSGVSKESLKNYVKSAGKTKLYLWLGSRAKIASGANHEQHQQSLHAAHLVTISARFTNPQTFFCRGLYSVKAINSGKGASFSCCMIVISA